MARRKINYPHNISYRLDDEAWAKLEETVASTGLSPHDWCRLAALGQLNEAQGLSLSQRLLFEHFVRAEYLVARGFQLLAEDKLTAEEWNKFRALANDKSAEIAARALAMHDKRNGHKE